MNQAKNAYAKNERTKICMNEKETVEKSFYVEKSRRIYA